MVDFAYGKFTIGGGLVTELWYFSKEADMVKERIEETKARFGSEYGFYPNYVVMSYSQLLMLSFEGESAEGVMVKLAHPKMTKRQDPKVVEVN